jgi:phosphoribosylpyrophosphate synthetase
MLLFALDASREFGAAVAAQLGHPLAAHEERTFEDGEHKIRPLVDPDGNDVFVVQSLHGGPAAESLLRAPVERVFVTDAVPLFRLTAPAARERVEVLPGAGLLAAEIRKQHTAWC